MLANAGAEALLLLEVTVKGAEVDAALRAIPAERRVDRMSDMILSEERERRWYRQGFNEMNRL